MFTEQARLCWRDRKSIVLLIESRVWPTEGGEADVAVDAEAEIRAGNAEYLVEQDFELAEGFVAEQSGAAVPAAVTGRQNLGLVRGLERAGGEILHRDGGPR